MMLASLSYLGRCVYLSDAVYVGNNVVELTKNYTFSAISRVTIQIDSQNSVTAGDDTGRELIISCPWGTKTMANNILNSVKNYKYQPFEANQALLDPAAEVGDAITTGGIYSVIVNTDISYDGTCMATITAPEDEEVDSEYPYLPKIERKVLSAQDTADNAQSTADSALSAAQDAASNADDANLAIQAWRYPGADIQIDGSNILAGTVMASELLGGIVGLLNAYENQVGTITITGASSADVAVELSSIGALRLTADGGNVFIQSSNGNYIQVGSNISVNNNFIPNASDYYSLGSSSFKWTDVYATNSTIQTSDRKVKTNINYDMSGYDEFFKQIKPVTYKFADGHRTHIGYIAQDIETALNECNISTEEFAGFVKDGENYALRYGEFIALNTYQIQLLRNRVEAQEAEINELKQEIQKIKNELGGAVNG